MIFSWIQIILSRSGRISGLQLAFFYVVIFERRVVLRIKRRQTRLQFSRALARNSILLGRDRSGSSNLILLPLTLYKLCEKVICMSVSSCFPKTNNLLDTSLRLLQYHTLLLIKRPDDPVHTFSISIGFSINSSLFILILTH